MSKHKKTVPHILISWRSNANIFHFHSTYLLKWYLKWKWTHLFVTKYTDILIFYFAHSFFLSGTYCHFKCIKAMPIFTFCEIKMLWCHSGTPRRYLRNIHWRMTEMPELLRLTLKKIGEDSFVIIKTSIIS